MNADQPSPALAEARQLVAEDDREYHWPARAKRDTLAVALLRTVVAEETVERLALAIQAADNHGSGAMEDAAIGLGGDVSDWGAYLARAVLTALLERAREGTK